MTDLPVTIAGRGLSGRIFHAPLIDATPGLVVARITGSAEPLWEGPPPGLLVVATPNDTHFRLASEAIERGIPVVVEKPMATSAQEAAELVARARAAGVLLTPFHNRRWDSDHLTLRSLLDGGHLGRVVRYESRFERWRPEPKGGWREATPPVGGGGDLLDLGTHLIDQALQLFGPVTHVYAELAALRGTAADDDAFLALSHAEGTISHLHASALTGAPGPRLRVLGTDAAFVAPRLDSQEEALRAGQRPGATSAWGVEPQSHWGRLQRGEQSGPVRPVPGDWPSFYALLRDALRSGGPPPVDPEAAVAVLEVVEAARRSAERRELVALEA